MKFFNDMENSTREIIYRVIGFFLSSFLFTSFLPIFMFIIYMNKNSFFSYDFFLSGLFGLNIFFLFSSFIIFLFIIASTSSLFLITYILIKRLNNNNAMLLKSDYWTALFLLLMNISIIFLLSIEQLNIQSYVIYLLLVSVPITIHFAIVAFERAKLSIYSLIATFIWIISIFIHDTTKTSEIVSLGLSAFNAGNKNVEVKNIETKDVTNGKMLLLSPENIFLTNKENNITNIIIIKRENLIIKIKK